MELFEVCVAEKAFSSVPIGLLRLAAYRVVDVSRKGWWTGEIDSLLVRAISNLGCLLHQTFDLEDSKRPGATQLGARNLQICPTFHNSFSKNPPEAGTLGALVVALQRHVDDAPVRRAACCALGMICSGEDASDHSRAARAVEVSIAANGQLWSSSWSTLELLFVFFWGVYSYQKFSDNIDPVEPQKTVGGWCL